MAVYKASECYPFLNATDFRVGKEIEGAFNNVPIVSVSCKVNTSNKDITGYRIVLMNEAGEEIFANKDNNGDYIISPISELPKYENYANNEYFPIEDEDANMGYNGSYIKIPFVQEKNNPSSYHILTSYNCIYYEYDNGDDNDDDNDNDSTQNKNKWYRFAGINGITQTEIYEQIDNISNNGMALKWVIYLYQGTPDSEDVNKVTYNNLDATWYDQKLFEGTILGSNGERIQITPTENVVLYQRFLQLGYIDDKNDFITSGNRAPITTYDSYYGHIYPQEGYYAKNILENILENEKATKIACQVYKHSNDEEYIDAGDIVDFVITTNIANFPNCGLTPVTDITVEEGKTVLVIGQTDLFQNGVWISHAPGTAWTRSGSYDTWGDFIGKIIFAKAGSGNGKNYQSQARAGGTLSLYKNALKRQEVSYVNTNAQEEGGDIWLNDDEGTIIKELGEWAEEEGSSILFVGRSNSWQNGIYTIQNKTIYGQQVKVAVRANGYKEWRDYHGLCVKVANSNLYYSSNAQMDGTINTSDLTFTKVDGYDYWTPGTSLIFREEQPIMLYPKGEDNSLNSPINISCYSNTSGVPSGHIIDNYTMKVGDKVLTQDKVYTWIEQEIYDERTGQWILQEKFDGGVSLEKSDTYYILNGSVYGGEYFEVVEITGTTQSKQTLSNTTATVYVNKPNDPDGTGDSEYSTFISPFVGVEEGQKIFFKNGKTVPGTSGTEAVEYSSLTIDKVDTKLWRVNFKETTAQPLSSIDAYKYELRTFFKSSDENQFYIYPTGYINVRFHWESVEKISEDDVNTSLYFFKKDGQLWYTADIKKIQTVTVQQRYAPIEFIYDDRDSGLSWNYYEMAIATEEGLIIQDTGKVFKGNRLETFYGLNTESQVGEIYYVILLAEDSTGQLYSTVAKIIIQAIPDTEEGAKFEATFDCEQQAIKLRFYSYGFEFPYKATDGEGNEKFSPADNSLSYNISNNGGNTGVMNISGKNGSFDAEISKDRDGAWSLYFTNASATSSEAVCNGITYGQSFNSDGSSAIDSKAIIELESLGDDKDNDGYSVCFSTTLDGNFCGPIWTAEISYMSKSEVEGSIVEAEKTGYIEIRLADNTKGEDQGEDQGLLNTSNLREDRKYLSINLVNKNTGSAKNTYLLNSTADDDYYNFLHLEEKETPSFEWYLSPENQDAHDEYLHGISYKRDGEICYFYAYEYNGDLYNNGDMQIWFDEHDIIGGLNDGSPYVGIVEEDDWDDDGTWTDKNYNVLKYSSNKLVAKKRHLCLEGRKYNFAIRFKPKLFDNLEDLEFSYDNSFSKSENGYRYIRNQAHLESSIEENSAEENLAEELFAIELICKEEEK